MNNKFEHRYKDLIERILIEGSYEENRTGVKAKTLFAQNLKIDMSDGLLPIVTAKKIFFNKAFHEYIWIINGCRNIDYLNKHNIHWWDKYATPSGDLGKTYGYQLRNYNGEFDQLSYIQGQLRFNTRRAHITLWNPSDLKDTILPCCYTGLTFVRTDNKLNLSIDFRSSDAFLGLPYDILFGALFLKDVSESLEINIGELYLNLNNVHIYENNIEPAGIYLQKPIYDLPKMKIKNDELINYNHGPYIKAPLN